jgi:hypothetical protein
MYSHLSCSHKAMLQLPILHLTQSGANNATGAPHGAQWLRTESTIASARYATLLLLKPAKLMRPSRVMYTACLLVMLST